MNSNVKELMMAAEQLISQDDCQSIDRILLAVEAVIESGANQFVPVKELIRDTLTYIDYLQNGFFYGEKEEMIKDIQYSLATLQAQEEGYVSVVDRMLKEAA
jgi:hypothetical protein